MPMSATPKMGASGSLLIAMMVSEEFIPTRCWICPDTPQAMYTLGRTVLPVFTWEPKVYWIYFENGKVVQWGEPGDFSGSAASAVKEYNPNKGAR